MQLTSIVVCLREPARRAPYSWQTYVSQGAAQARVATPMRMRTDVLQELHSSIHDALKCGLAFNPIGTRGRGLQVKAR